MHLETDPSRRQRRTRLASDLALADLLEQSDVSDCASSRTDATWPLASPLDRLLIEGGDERLAVDPRSGLNRYGCSPRPRPGVFAFASCTASSISAEAYEEAELCRRRMLRDARSPDGSALRAIARETLAVRRALVDWWGVGDIAEVILAASGTDAVLLLTGLLCGIEPATSILMSPSETGSGVPEAARGRHFARLSADGGPASPGCLIDGFAPIALSAVSLRESDGTLRDAAAVARGCEAAVMAACQGGGRALLHAIDGSKTGLSAPGLATLLELRRCHAGQLEIVIDACQARLSPARLRRYLAADLPVLITGSKFFGGPGFSGALLLPRARFPDLSLPPAGLAAYGLASCEELQATACANAGLVLRWRAALAEMARFRRSAARFGGVVDRLAAEVRRQIAADPDLLGIDVPEKAGPGADWTDRRTVFTFAVREDGRLASVERLRVLHGLLNRDLSAELPDADPALTAALCQGGQPVLLGSRDGQSFGGLRIAIGARHAAAEDTEAALRTVFAKLRLVGRSAGLTV